MAKPNRSAIQHFAVLTQKSYTVGIIDINDNGKYMSKEDIMSEWIAILEKNEDGTFLLRFTYELNPLSTNLSNGCQ